MVRDISRPALSLEIAGGLIYGAFMLPIYRQVLVVSATSLVKSFLVVSELELACNLLKGCGVPDSDTSPREREHRFSAIGGLEKA
jgi:hypothetical protein